MKFNIPYLFCCVLEVPKKRVKQFLFNNINVINIIILIIHHCRSLVSNILQRAIRPRIEFNILNLKSSRSLYPPKGSSGSCHAPDRIHPHGSRVTNPPCSWAPPPQAPTPVLPSPRGPRVPETKTPNPCQNRGVPKGAKITKGGDTD
jgi:hypothetical protein